MPSPPTGPTWEEVLASFEATADAAERLLDLRCPVPPPADLVPEYDPWQLALPPLPEELVLRARSIHERQEMLRERLRRSSNTLRQQEQLVLTAGGPIVRSAESPVPVYVDRQA